MKYAKMRLIVNLNRPVQRLNTFFSPLLKSDGEYPTPQFQPKLPNIESSKLSRNKTLNVKMTHCLL